MLAISETMPKRKNNSSLGERIKKYIASKKKKSPAVASYPVLENIKSHGETLRIKLAKIARPSLPVIFFVNR
jgi:hypothetical protein